MRPDMTAVKRIAPLKKRFLTQFGRIVCSLSHSRTEVFGL